MYPRLLQLPLRGDKSFFLFGPRGTGKTTWLRNSLPEALYFDLLESDVYVELLARPVRLEQLIPPGYKGWIIIDEVQKIPMLLSEVHRLIEKYRYKFILTGSSARSLKKKGINLLAGRALTYHMHPLTTQELGGDFDLVTSLKYGHLPSVPSESDPAKYLHSYINTYIREEVLQEGLTRNVGAFARFLEIASLSQGCVLNLSEVAREAHISRKVIEEYFSILEDLLIGRRLPIFTKRSKRRMSSHPKFYFFDVGVFRTIRPMGPLDSPAEAEGPGLETLFLQELAAYNDYFELGYEIAFWRTSAEQEVDFVLYGPKGLMAFEIKRSSQLSSRDFRGLNAFLTDYPEAKAYLVYGGQREEFRGKITAIPILDALKKLPHFLNIDIILQKLSPENP